MAHSVTVQPALAVRAALMPAPTDLQRLLLRLDLENQQARGSTLRVRTDRCMNHTPEYSGSGLDKVPV